MLNLTKIFGFVNVGVHGSTAPPATSDKPRKPSLTMKRPRSSGDSWLLAHPAVDLNPKVRVQRVRRVNSEPGASFGHFPLHAGEAFSSKNLRISMWIQIYIPKILNALIFRAISTAGLSYKALSVCITSWAEWNINEYIYINIAHRGRENMGPCKISNQNFMVLGFESYLTQNEFSSIVMASTISIQ